ncbi:MAG: hypothetical protein WC934_02970 [Acidithiobacillus sp.]|jgi:hypothetical protein|uniref:hypothetical protein n=1 Tax=Acidithiobacillus sp. TaxID=1872118 RepID=UPI00355D005C
MVKITHTIEQLQKKLKNLEKLTYKASNKMHKERYTNRDEAIKEYNLINTERSKIEQKLNRLNEIETEINHIVTKKYTKTHYLPTEQDANNQFWKYPTELRDEIEQKTSLNNENMILLRDYPYDEAGNKLDLKEWEEVFTNKHNDILCKVRISTIGTDSKIFTSEKQFGNKLNTIYACGFSDEEVNQKLANKLFERSYYNSNSREGKIEINKKYLSKEENE